MKPYEVLAGWTEGWATHLADHLWQATLFSLVALVVAAALKRAPASARYFVWLVALIKFALPSALLGFLLAQAGIRLPAPATYDLHSPGTTLTVSPLLSPAAGYATSARAPGPPAGPASSDITAAEAAREESSRLYGAAACLWLAGCLLLLVAWSRGRRNLSAALRRGEAVGDGRESDALVRVQSKLGLRRKIGLVITPAVSEPGVWGVWRPVLVLPEGVADQLDDDEFEAVLTHELAHVARWDNLVGNLQRLLCCLFWFHPLIWLVNSRLLAEREQACDDTVVRCGGASDVYVRGITKVCRYCLGPEVAGLSRASGSDLKRRVERIVSGHAGQRPSALQCSLVGAIVAAAVTFSLAAGGGVEPVAPAADGRAPAVDAIFEVSDAAPQMVPNTGGVAGANSHGLPKGGRPTTAARPRKEGADRAPATGDLERSTAEAGAPAATAGEPPGMLGVLVGLVDELLPPDEGRLPSSEGRAGAPIVRASEVDYGDLRRFVGRYEVDPQRAENFVLDITLEGAALWLKPSHAAKRRLVPHSPTEFTDAYSEFHLTGILDERGRVAGLKLDSWGATARKLSLPPPSVKGNTTFRLRGYPDAKVVAVAGTFNDWNQSQLLFTRAGDEWVCRVQLAPGTHQYKFIVDGNWLTDPNNPRTMRDERGIKNSLLRAE